VFLAQVHGTNVATLDRDDPDGLEADAAVTDMAGVACTVLVADCLPVLLADTAGRRVAAVHCGWRGLAGGVLDNALAAFADLRGEVVAWLGPCIGPERFEVGPDVFTAFCAHDAGAEACFTPQPDGNFLANLPTLARRRLAQASVARIYGNDGGALWCTVQNPKYYFSYRRDQQRLGATGRMAACIWRTFLFG
jgi:YfiH family protein